MTFRQLALCSSVLLFGLSALWLCCPELMLTQWGVPYTESAGFVSRRAAAFYAGFALMLLLVRNAAASGARFALATGLSFSFLMLATLGIFEWLSGGATAHILAAVVLEAGLAVAFLRSNSSK